MRQLPSVVCFFLISLSAVLAEEVKIRSIEANDFAPAETVPLETQALSADPLPPDSKPLPTGLASWYGGKFQGRQTASGEIFDTRQFTAAHRTLPFGTLVKVVNLDNGKTTTVRINDRGPFVKDRIIDLSQAAAVEINMMKTGVARVSLEVLNKPAAGRSHFYRIQVASFKNRDNAHKIKGLLTEQGYTVYFESTPEGLVRVNVDNVAQADLAKVKKALHGLGFEKQLVRAIE
jgi:rare lipoprotein A